MAEEDLTLEEVKDDFLAAYQAKHKLIERERSDFLFALGEQWSPEEKATLERANIKPFVDNRIQPNLFLLTGLERQNRTDFRAFPAGEEDGVKAEITSALFKDCIKKSGFQYKSSEQFKDGITCGESHLELYLDHTDSLINGKPCWNKCDGDSIFPEPCSREYDFSDAKYVYKVKLNLDAEDLINVYPEKKKLIEAAGSSRLDLAVTGGGETTQTRGYRSGGQSVNENPDDDYGFDLVERYYRKWVEKVFVGDYKTGQIQEVRDQKAAAAFVQQYLDGIAQDQQAHAQAVQQTVQAHVASLPPEQQALPMDQHLAAINEAGALPPPPPEQDPKRFVVIKKQVPEIWCFAYTPAVEEPLADERAWFYPKWKNYPFVPYFARFSTAPVKGPDRHLLVQGLVYGVKGAQEKHNKAEMLMLRHLNSATNSGWLAEEDSWVDRDRVKNFGSTPGINLEYKSGKPKPERIFPSPLSAGHEVVSQGSAESIKEQLGINSDLLATQQGQGGDSGRAIALRQKQGLLMVQELFDNLSRSREIAGRLLLSQFGEMYDLETAKKVLGEAFLMKNFPPLMLMNPQTMQQEPQPGPDGQPMRYDVQMAELAIAEVLSGEVEEYDVTVGEAVASETARMAASAEIKDISTSYPGLVPPDVLVKYSQIPEAAKTEILASIERAQQLAAAQAAGGAAPPADGPGKSGGANG